MNERRPLVPGIVLVGVGLYILFSRRFGWSGPGPVLLLLGAIFLAVSATRRFRGPLLPAGVLLGLGAGFLLRDALPSPEASWWPILLGLGCGFLFVHAVDRAGGRKRDPSPLLPGAILTGIAVAGLASRSLPLAELLARLEPLWPAAIIAAGAWLVFTALRRRRV